MAELYQTTPQNITMHIKAIIGDGELEEAATCKDFLQVRTEGTRTVQRTMKHYNLDMVLSVPLAMQKIEELLRNIGEHEN